MNSFTGQVAKWAESALAPTIDLDLGLGPWRLAPETESLSGSTKYPAVNPRAPLGLASTGLLGPHVGDGLRRALSIWTLAPCGVPCRESDVIFLFA